MALTLPSSLRVCLPVCLSVYGFLSIDVNSFFSSFLN